MENIQISAQATPNPATYKFLTNLPLVESGTYNFPGVETAGDSPLAEALFKIPGVKGVMIGNHFISVSIFGQTSWVEMAEPVITGIRSFLEQPNAVVVSASAKSTADETRTLTEVEKKITEILDNEIRPAIAMDGGDVSFVGFEEGVVSLHMQGACSSCPSSVYTLKIGIENRLREEIPEVKEVVQV